VRYIHRIYAIKQQYLLNRTLLSVRSDIEDALIDCRGFASGLLIEIKCPGSCTKEVEKTITLDWVYDPVFGAIIQEHCLEIRVYDGNLIATGFTVKFLPDKPYRLTFQSG
jgi:hypothetical protein